MNRNFRLRGLIPGRIFGLRAANAIKRRAGPVARRMVARLVLRFATGHWAEPRLNVSFVNGINNEVLRAVLKSLLSLQAGRNLLVQLAIHAWHWERSGVENMNFPGAPDLGGNLLTAWTGPDISFMHTEKCGGVSVVHWLTKKFHPEQINVDPWRDFPPHLIYRAPPGLLIDTARYPLIWGHFDLPSLRRIDPNRLVFTILREPRARLLSLYWFWRSVDPINFHPDISFTLSLAQRLSLEEFLACDDPLIVDSIDNIYVRRLTGHYVTGAAIDPLAAAPEAALAAAQLALKTIDFVGFTEQLHASAGQLAAMLGLAPPPASPRANITAENHRDPSGWFRRVERLEVSPAAQEGLDRRTVLDRQLYAQALQAFMAEAPVQPAIASSPSSVAATA